MTQNIPAHGSNIARKDINEIYKWKIDDLYADKESWQAAAQNLKAELSRFEEFKGRLGEAQILLQALQKQAQLSEEISKIYAYARLQLDDYIVTPHTCMKHGIGNGFLICLLFH